VPKLLKAYFSRNEITKSLGTKDFKLAKMQVEFMYNQLQNIIHIKKSNMIDDESIRKIVNKYINERLHSDYIGRLNKSSFSDYSKHPNMKQASFTENILRRYKNDLSKFNLSKVKLLAEEFALEEGDEFDINKISHKKLALELLRGNITILEEIVSRNKGNWNYDNVAPVDNQQNKKLPTIAQSVEMYLTKRERTNPASERRTRDTRNFFYQVAIPLIEFTIDDLDSLDDESISEIQNNLLRMPRRSGRARTVDISEYLEKELYNKDEYQELSNESLRRYIGWMRSYLIFLKEKDFIKENLYEYIPQLNNDCSNKRTYLEKEEISILFRKSENDIKLVAKILAYSGMRLSEIFKCTIEIKNGIKYFDLSLDTIKLKTKSSHRKIPIHKKLKNIINEQKLQELQLKYENNKYFLSKKLNQIIHEHISKDKRKVAYSLRHSFATFLKYAMVEESITADLMGHSKGRTITYGVYASMFPLETLETAINKLDYNIKQ